MSFLGSSANVIQEIYIYAPMQYTHTGTYMYTFVFQLQGQVFDSASQHDIFQETQLFSQNLQIHIWRARKTFQNRIIINRLDI